MKAVLDREGVYMGKTYDEWIRLDKAYPDGVRYTQAGFPDFSIYAYKDKMGNPIQVKLKELGGGNDFNKANKILEERGIKLETGYTWHHIENTSELILVDTKIHDAIRHTGGVATAK